MTNRSESVVLPLMISGTALVFIESIGAVVQFAAAEQCFPEHKFTLGIWTSPRPSATISDLESAVTMVAITSMVREWHFLHHPCPGEGEVVLARTTHDDVVQDTDADILEGLHDLVGRVDILFGRVTLLSGARFVLSVKPTPIRPESSFVQLIAMLCGLT